MALRSCSTLGTLLFALSMAQPAFAEDKPDAAASARDTAKKKSKKKKQAETDAAGATGDGEATPGAGAAAEEPPPEPDAWERPPAEEEKPPPPPPPAHEVEEPVGDGKPFSVGLLAGYGFMTDRRATGYAGDPYTWGAGIRGGYAFDSQLYVGAYFVYYLGSETTGDSGRFASATTTTSANYMHFGVEAGYDWWIGPLIIRPSLKLGPALAFTDNPTSAAKTIGDFMLGPGFTVVHPMDDLFLGGDARANIVTGDGVSDVLIAATFGLRF